MAAAPDRGAVLDPPDARVRTAGDAEVASGARPRRLSRHLTLCAGCFALLLAALLPLFVYPRLASLPADPQQTQVQESPSADVLVADPDSPAGARVVHDTPLRVTTHVSAAPGPVRDDSVVWLLATRVTAPGHGLVNAQVERVSLNRRTAEPTNCCGDRLVTDQAQPAGRPLIHHGYVTFPFDVRQRAYDLWDVQLGRPRSAAFLGEERRDGFRTYRFETVTPPEEIGTQDLPGRLFGLRKPSVTATAVYEDTRTYWVEPVTGAVVDIHERLRQTFRYDGREVPAVSATLDSPALDGELRATLRQGAMVLPWLQGKASLVLLVVGLALLAFWARPAYDVSG